MITRRSVLTLIWLLFFPWKRPRPLYERMGWRGYVTTDVLKKKHQLITGGTYPAKTSVSAIRLVCAATRMMESDSCRNESKKPRTSSAASP